MKPTVDLAPLLWPTTRAGDALEALAHQCGLIGHTRDVPILPASLDCQDPAALGRWVDWAARRLGFEAEEIVSQLGGFAARLSAAAPALLHLPAADGEPGGLLLIVGAGGKNLHLLTQDLQIRKVPSQGLADCLRSPMDAPYLAAFERLLNLAKVPPQRQRQARDALLHEHLADQTLGQCWLVRMAPQTGFWEQLKHAGLPGKVLAMLGAFAFVYLAEIAGWALIGQITLNGHLDLGWLAAWTLLVLSLVPLNLLAGWLDTTFALDFGRLLKTRLLAGILRFDIDTIRQQGAGQLLSRVMESQALESLALNGGMGVMVATLELGIAASILLSGAGGWLHLGLLAAWLLLSLGLSYRYFQRLRAWTLMRLDMTHRLVETMVGHRTRLAQERADKRGAREDALLHDYVEASRAMDQTIVPAVALLPRGWMLVGLLGLLPVIVNGSANAASLAIALGGMLLANRALTGISTGLAALSRANVAWSQVSALFGGHTAQATHEPFLATCAKSPEILQPQAHAIVGGEQQKPGSPPAVMEASQLTFGYGAQGNRVLSGVNLSIARGDQILLQGPSGGGKSTLASLLVGLRHPESGLLLLNGLDHHTLGDAWHGQVTQAPQFHENHILSGPLAYNLLIGRNWPASPAELAEAGEICEELGLAELLEKMPAGIMQMVGETGWQLSHGERSRVFLARALLQKAHLTVLDESFAALDPETLKLCLDCALRRSQTLLVIAHP